MEKDAKDSSTFDISTLLPNSVIDSRGDKEPFEIEDIIRKLSIQTGLDLELSQKVADVVALKLIKEKAKEIKKSQIREMVCTELTIRGLDKAKKLFMGDTVRFHLSEDFIEQYRGRQPKFGPLGYITYKRTYARVKPDGNKEEFWESLQRVIEGVYSLQKTHCKENRLPWNEKKAQKSAQRMFEKVWEFKMCPPGRGFWIMGTDFVRRHGSMALNNCFAYDTEIITKEGIKKIGDCVGTNQILLSRGGKWIEAPIRSFGKQKLVKLTLKQSYNIFKEVYCTSDHIWFVKVTPNKNEEFRRVKTTELKKDLFLSYAYPNGLSKTTSEFIHPRKLMWKVSSVEETDREEEVFCATVPNLRSFALEGNILTSNCGFVSTTDIGTQKHIPFIFLMDALMLGVGVGFDTKGAGKIEIKQPTEGSFTFKVPDSREGWLTGLELMLTAFFEGKQIPTYDYSLVRPKGSPINGFGGVASGPDPLDNMYQDIRKLLENKIGQTLTSVDIVDIMNFIGRCVVAGNVRRCLTETQRIATLMGYKKISVINVGNFVLTSDGSYKKIITKFDQGIQETIKINTSHGSIECTPNHRMAIYNGLESYEWKYAGDLTTKDRLISVVHTEGKKGISEDEMWLIGYYHGDGNSYIRENHGGGTVSLAMSTENYNKGLKDKCFSVLQKMGYDPKENIQNTYVHIRVFDKSFATYILRYKKPHQPPVITEEIWNGTPEMRASYLAGLSDSDGGDRNILLYSTRLDFIQDIQKIALSLGIATTLHERDSRYNEERDKCYRGCHYLHIRGIQSQIRAKEIIEPYCAIWKCEVRKAKKNGLSIPYQILLDARERRDIDFQPLSSGLIRGTKSSGKKYKDANFDTLIEKGLVNPDWIPIEILSIEPNGEKHTYDIEVEGNHNFVCEGFLVHNSAEIALGDPNDMDYVQMKDYTKYQFECNDRRWASNNSVIVDPNSGFDYGGIAKNIAENGEPGIVWLENSRAYSRMNGVKDYKDRKAMGVNPCFVGDTLIAVADGRGAVAIQQLSEEKRDIPVYSLNEEGLVEIKMGRHPRITGHNQEVIKIVFEDGTTLTVTPNHKMILLNGTQLRADELKKGDNLPRFSKYNEKFKDKEYLRVYRNTRDRNAHKKYEHRMIAHFNNPQQWKKLYQEGIVNGFVKSNNIVVHHKDENTLNNTPENLEIMSFSKHSEIRGFYDVAGENNPMFGKSHSEDTKKLIGNKTTERCQDDEYREKLNKAIKKGMDDDQVKAKISISRKEEWKRYYLEFERETDLETVWIDEQLYVKKNCEICNKEMILPIGEREQCYCSISCSNKKKESIEKRKEGQKQYFEERQQNILHHQINIYKNLQLSLSRNPYKKEWEAECKKKEVSFRCNPHSSNQFVLKSFGDLKKRAKEYNHRVLRVERTNIKQDVYNITVDDNHNVGIITSFDPETMRCDGVFTMQCGEQTLESSELCCLVETFPSRHDTYEEYEETLKYAYLYAKSVTLMNTHWKETNQVMGKNRRIGTSMSGIIEAINKFGRRKFLQWCDKGYAFLQKQDEKYSDWLTVPKSIKITTVKPSGSVSLLPGVSSGIHYPHSEYYIRRIRIAKKSKLIKILENAGYHMEEVATGERTMMVVDFYVHEKNFIRGKKDVSMWEQLQNAADLQRYWSDNQVSITVTFDKKTEGKDIVYALECFEDKLKSVSLLPISEHGYAQAPYEEITKEQYEEFTSKLKPLDLGEFKERSKGVLMCDGDSCEVSYE